MFARIQLPIGPPRQSILINEACLVSDQSRQMLYVVGPPDDKGECEVSAHYVTTGPQQNGLRVIEEDLNADHKLGLGDKVVLNGLQRVRDKAKVQHPEGSGHAARAISPRIRSQAVKDQKRGRRSDQGACRTKP